MSATDSITVRLGRPEDMSVVFEMIKKTADNNGVHGHEHLTIQKLLVDLFECKPSWCSALVAEQGGASLGAAVYRRGYWSWSGRTLVLVGLYVRPPARGKGLGRRLVLELCRLALAEHAQLDWLQPRDPTALGFFAQFRPHNITLDDHCTMKMRVDSITLAATRTPGTDCVSSERRDRSDVVHNQSPDANQNMVTARLALLDDMAAISDMINELAVYQEHPDGPQLSVKDLEEDGFGSSPWFFAFVAERDGVAVGMVMGNRDWDGTRGHYLQSLYVRPSARRCGVAVLLIKEFCKIQ
ncbi:uncharacterized protein isoform X2 [Choristoneura fumiferana]|uniref:uncharacterized protein isoform X2 n=1 Tax=Choristoneura fumiferana TaxID=7141 RepID=UPI003D155C23